MGAMMEVVFKAVVLSLVCWGMLKLDHKIRKKRKQK